MNGPLRFALALISAASLGGLIAAALCHVPLEADTAAVWFWSAVGIAAGFLAVMPEDQR